jgi:hypothetical protein
VTPDALAVAAMALFLSCPDALPCVRLAMAATDFAPAPPPDDKSIARFFAPAMAQEQPAARNGDDVGAGEREARVGGGARRGGALVGVAEQPGAGRQLAAAQAPAAAAKGPLDRLLKNAASNGTAGASANESVSRQMQADDRAMEQVHGEPLSGAGGAVGTSFGGTRLVGAWGGHSGTRVAGEQGPLDLGAVDVEEQRRILEDIGRRRSTLSGDRQLGGKRLAGTVGRRGKKPRDAMDSRQQTLSALFGKRT